MFFLKLRKLKPKKIKEEVCRGGEQSFPFSSRLKKNLEEIEHKLGNSTDLIIRKFNVGKIDGLKGALVYVNGLVDIQVVHEQVLKPLIYATDVEDIFCKGLINSTSKDLEELGVLVGDVKEERCLNKALDNILEGQTLVILDKVSSGLIVDTRGWKSRSIEESFEDPIIRGPKESFVETLRLNTAMLRRRIHSADFRIEEKAYGKVTKTLVAVCYIEGIVDPQVVKEIYRRLNRIEIDGILDSGYIEELIQDHRFTVFPTIAHTDRPDKVAANLLEGRVAIIVDGSPAVLTAPAVFMEFLQASDDYYERYIITTLIRWIRMLSLFITYLLPAFYVAMVAYHIESLPVSLMINIAAGRGGTPFPIVVEAVIMGITFEILREAGLRLPKQVGQAVSIVGVLVIGQAAVEAGVVSPIMVIVTALTAIASFAIPSYSFASAFIPLRLIALLMAAFLGAFGVMVSIIALVIHLATVRSVGVPYLAPISPTSFSGTKDTLVRVPWWSMYLRPKRLTDNEVRQSKGKVPIERAGVK
jgi:spore germination protein KA